MRMFFARFVFLIQIFLFEVSYFFFNFFKSKKVGTIVGTSEIASILYSIGNSIDDAKTVKISGNKFYNHKYDFDFEKIWGFKHLYVILSPILLGYLLNRYKNFIYISSSSFLISSFDAREYEFKKIKQRSCNLICIFTGSEIRSFELLKNYAKENNIDVVTTYQNISNIGIDSAKNELFRKKLAEMADKYADLIFNPNIDQMSYFKRKTYPALYFADDAKIKFFPEKFKKSLKKNVVHAPSSPIIKGTPLVRAAVKKLQEEGYDFKYVELIGVPNTKVLEELQRAHIVLNEFYAFVPGVFGIEAMMNNTVLLTSADRNIEPSLFEGANDAWVVTPYWQVYDKLKEQLDKPMEELKIQADKGTEWTKKYASYSFSAAYLQKIIKSLEND